MSIDNSQGKRIIPQLSTNELNYSVKVSFVLAFHESELLEVMRTTMDEIVKDIPDQVRQHRTENLQPPSTWASTELAKFSALGAADLAERQYHSWGILKDLPHSTSPQNPRGRRTIWPYTTEPQKILARKIIANGSGARYTIRNHKAQSLNAARHHARWLLTVDSALSGSLSRDILSCISGGGSGDKWDSFGLKVVFPVYSTDTNKGEQEISQMLRAVASRDKTTAAFVTDHCGLHVQVECPDGIKFLQALATLILIYESQISRLNHSWRRPSCIAAQDIIEGNRFGLIAEDGSLFARLKSHYRRVKCDEAHLKERLTIEQLRELVAAQTDRHELVRMLNWPASMKYGDELGDRNRQVDFTTAIQDDGSLRCISFRSARSSLCGRDVSRWVDFCVGLVRLATFYSENPEQFPVQHWDEGRLVDEGKVASCLNVFALMEDMGMDRVAINYWEHQAATFMVGGLPKCDCEDTTNCEQQGDIISPRNDSKNPQDSSTASSRRKRRYSGADIDGHSPVSRRRKLDNSISFGVPIPVKAKRRHSNDDAGPDGTKRRRPVLITFVDAAYQKTVSKERPKTITPKALSPNKPLGTTNEQTTPESISDVEPGGDLRTQIVEVTRRIGEQWTPFLASPITTILARGYASPGVLSHTDSLVHDDFSWRIEHFHFSYWATVTTSSTINLPTRTRYNVCGVLAILQSLRYQYPDVPRPRARELLAIGDRLAPTMANPTPELNNADDDLLDAILMQWNGGEFVLVTITSSEPAGYARRLGASTRLGSDLYVHHTAGSKLMLGHWEGMRRKTSLELEAQRAARKTLGDAQKNKE